jgi:carboxypeptidase Q
MPPDIQKLYASKAQAIIDHTLKQNDAYAKLEHLCDDIGHRLSGSPQLEKAIDWAVRTLKADGQENVRAEEVMVLKWVRGDEFAMMTSPRLLPIAMLGLGGSVATPSDGLIAPVIVVADEKELEAIGNRAAGKIVLFNNPMPEYDTVRGSCYGECVRFRGKGAILAAKQGAVACLVRSVTARSLRSPHTGAMKYDDDVRKIPAAAISTEDADIMSRLCARGQKVIVHLKMSARDMGLAPSANVVAEIVGTELPGEVVVIGGHIDSWDVGQGAHDDGAGSVMSMEALNVIRKMGLKPRRTIRVVLWTNEENGLAGGKAYASDHASELANHVAAIETDSGGFRPESFGVECTDAKRVARAIKQLEAITALMKPLGTIPVNEGHSGADVSPMKNAGVMLMGLATEGSTYFDYHHSQADTLDKVDPRQLSESTAAMAVMAYILADMPERLGE